MELADPGLSLSSQDWKGMRCWGYREHGKNVKMDGLDGESLFIL